MSKKELLLLICSVVFTLIVSEAALRAFGFKPGRVTNPIGLWEVDKLEKNVGFTADSMAVTHFDTTPRAAIRSYILQNNEEPLLRLYDTAIWMGEYQQLANDYRSVLTGDDKGVFALFVQRILNKPESSRTDFDSAVLNFVGNPFNEFGFRSMAFRKKSSRKRVLLLGDSFTYGYNAQNKTYSFADLLIANGYEVYNTGLGGSDPPQYLSIAREFIPLIKPDIVVANICLGNDAGTDSQSYRPFQPHHYVTNAGWLESCPQGVNFSSAEEVYKVALSTCYIPQNSFWNKLCSSTCITTMLWALNDLAYDRKLSITACCGFEAKAAKFKLKEPYINNVMKKIEKICVENQSSFVISVIPNNIEIPKPLIKRIIQPLHHEFVLQYVKDIEGLFPNQSFFEPHHLLPEHYGPNDSHFNERGHALYAEFLTQMLDSISLSQSVTVVPPQTPPGNRR